MFLCAYVVKNKSKWVKYSQNGSKNVTFVQKEYNYDNSNNNNIKSNNSFILTNNNFYIVIIITNKVTILFS